MQRSARIRLTADPACDKCGGKGVEVRTEYSSYWDNMAAELKIQVRLCRCIKAELAGKLKLPVLDAGAIEPVAESLLDNPAAPE